MRVKICGITRMEDALEATQEGASAIGFIFVPSSPRCISTREARAMVENLPPHVSAVGVVADTSREDTLRIIEESGIAAVQFHGNEKPEDILEYPVPVYKAFHVGAGFSLAQMEAYSGNCFLLDTAVPGMLGGTGKAFDWAVAVRAKKFGRIILAGGLTEHTIARASREVDPYAFDVSSGVESAPGIKDRNKLRRLFAALRAEGHGSPPHPFI